MHARSLGLALIASAALVISGLSGVASASAAPAAHVSHAVASVQSQMGNVTVTGKVVDSADPTFALANVGVRLLSTSGDEVDYSPTDDDGTYSVTTDSPGDYTLQFLPEDRVHAQLFWGGTDSLDTATFFHLAGGTNVTKNIALDDGGSVTGTVTGANTNGGGLKDVEVDITSTDVDGPQYSTETDSDGTYEVDGIQAGSYTVKFDPSDADDGSIHSNYLTQWWSAKTAATADTMVVAADNSSEADATLAVGGMVTGTVTGADTLSGLADVDVTIEDTNGHYVDDAETNDDGQFTLYDLPTGNYKIDFDGTAASHVSEWFDDKPTRSSATLIAVTAGGAPAVADAQLALGGTISGTVTGGGVAETEGSLDLYNSAGQAVSEADLSNNDDGTFSFVGLAPGQYRLRVDSYGDGTFVTETWWNGGTSLKTATPITVSDSHTTTVNPTLVPGASVSGTVTDAVTHAGIQGISVQCYTSTGYYCPGGQDVETDANGHYTLSGLGTGSATIQFSDTDETTYASQFWTGAAVFSASTPVATTAGQSVTGINAAMVKAGTISGTVTDATTGAGVAGVEVSAYDADGSPAGFFGTDSEETDAAGHYSVSGLAPGTYTVHFITIDETPAGDHYADQWYDSKTSGDAATPVTVDVGATTANINAALVIGHTISGTITDATTHKAIDGVTVRIVGAGKDLYAEGYLNRGKYSISGLNTGTYRLKFLSDATGTSAYAYQWYSGKATQSTADPVALGSSDATANIQLSRGGSITGTVSGADGYDTVELYDSDGDLDGDSFGGSISSDGTFEYDGLPTGNYRLALVDNSGALPEEWYGGSSLASATTVAVTAGQTTTVNPTFSSLVLTAPQPTITGNAVFGQTLTAVPGTWGPAPVTLTYQWNSGTTPITGATSKTYVPTSGDVGHQLSVTVTGTKSGYPSSSITSDLTSSVIGATLTTATPTVTGNATVGAPLTANAGTWGPSPVTLTYQWNSSAGGAISGATSATYTPVTGDLGNTLTVTVTGKKAGYTDASLTSAPTSAVAAALGQFTAGTPTISGTPTSGQTLTVDPGSWTPTPDSYSYQWKRAGVVIPSATASTYKLTTSDTAKAITVTVTATKAGVAPLSATSAAVTIGKALTKSPTPKISGTPTVGSTLTATAGTWSPSKVTLKYQWNRNGTAIPAATASKYALVAADAGTSVTVTVTGSKTGYVTTARTSAADAVPLLLAATPTPTITGTAAVGQQLAAVPGDWEPSGVVLAYQWKRAGASISHATASTYTLTSSDAGKAITVTVTGGLTGYQSVAKTSTSVTPPKVLTKTPLPTIAGTALVGSTLTAHAGTWSPSKVTLKYQWNDNGTAITGATSSSYKPVAADGGAAITVTVTGSKTGYATVSRTSAAKSVPLQLTTTPSPTITGSSVVGQQLTAVPGDWSPAGVVFSYVWKRSGTAISHATLATYTLTKSDVGKAITVTVTGTLTGYQSVARTSTSVTATKS
jgi:hypothetical protein